MSWYHSQNGYTLDNERYHCQGLMGRRTMRINTRQLALETLLLMISATLVCMGVVGVVVGLSVPTRPFFATLLPDGALVTLLVGIALLATLQGWGKQELSVSYLCFWSSLTPWYIIAWKAVEATHGSAMGRVSPACRQAFF